MIELSGEDRVAGGKVSGRIAWPASKMPGGPITVWLVWHLSIKLKGANELGSRVTEDYAAVAKKKFSAAPSISFEFTIPPEGPVTYAGELFGIDWEIVAGTEGGWTGPDVLATRGFVVACRPAAVARAIEKVPAG